MSFYHPKLQFVSKNFCRIGWHGQAVMRRRLNRSYDFESWHRIPIDIKYYSEWQHLLHFLQSRTIREQPSTSATGLESRFRMKILTAWPEVARPETETETDHVTSRQNFRQEIRTYTRQIELPRLVVKFGLVTTCCEQKTALSWRPLSWC